jgi:hypothetical protein
LKLKAGEDDEEVVNAVIPLFGKKDADLKQILNSKLFHILMTFNVMQNADTSYDNAYIALLANTLVYLISKPASEWRDNLLDQLHITVKVVYGESKFF